MPPGESSCPGGSDYVWQSGVEAAEVYSIFNKKKTENVMLKKTSTVAIFKILLPKQISVGS